MTDVLTRPATLVDGQHTSHVELLASPVRPVVGAAVDAVIVPASRPASSLSTATALAADLGCPLVALCSHQADPASVQGASWESDATVIAASVRRPPDFPQLRTTRLLAKGPFERSADTSLKRNIALVLSRMAGWRHVLFLDDDILGVTAPVVRDAAALLPEFPVVGLANAGYHDNSVVCHANRDTGGDQATFVGAGALLFRGDTTSFFPEVYNEDWFFLLGRDRLADVAVSGSYRQARYDPYANPRRARQEEFGDCLAEGIYALLDDGRPISDADVRYWREFLDRRAEFIDAILRRLPTAPGNELRRDRMGAALRAARTVLDQITADLCVRYLRAWRRDRNDWAGYVEPLPRNLTPDEALAALGLKVWS
jgi:hypothetical protein